MVENVKFIKIKGPRETQKPDLAKIFTGRPELTKLENLPQGCGEMQCLENAAGPCFAWFIITTIGRNCIWEIFRAALSS